MRRYKSKDEIIKIVVECALLYKENLTYKTVLFVTDSTDNKSGFEALFMPHNFKHLTGVAKNNIDPLVFYNRAIGRKLSTNDIAFDERGFADMKLNVLRRLMNIHTTARMVGEHDGLSERIVADKFAGTTVSAMGFDVVNNLYVPVTALKKSVNNVTSKASRSRIIAIFVKQKSDLLYNHLTYIAKGVTIEDALLPAIQPKIDAINLLANFPIPTKKSDEAKNEDEE